MHSTSNHKAVAQILAASSILRAAKKKKCYIYLYICIYVMLYIYVM